MKPIVSFRRTLHVVLTFAFLLTSLLGEGSSAAMLDDIDGCRDEVGMTVGSEAMDDTSGNPSCTSTMIGPRHMITAAHCVVKYGTSNCITKVIAREILYPSC
jgi:hypothetical protein